MSMSTITTSTAPATTTTPIAVILTIHRGEITLECNGRTMVWPCAQRALAMAQANRLASTHGVEITRVMAH